MLEKSSVYNKFAQKIVSGAVCFSIFIAYSLCDTGLSKVITLYAV
jgi:hypothetical protein